MIHLLLAVIYLSFVSLGLPDSLLGAAWPSMYADMSAPVSYAGVLSMIIAAGTVISSLLSDRATKRFGTLRVTVCSVSMTALALLGFSLSTSFWQLCVWSLPYGLGAGSVDAALNNYVALHYKSCHMSWLHCMWGVGAFVGPLIMGATLTGGGRWTEGYRVIAAMQLAVAVVLAVSFPLWKKGPTEHRKMQGSPVLKLTEIVKIPGAKEVMLTFLCYCGLEQTAGLWASSYFTLYYGISADSAAGCTSLFYLGMTAGRGLSGFLTLKLNDAQMVRLGQALAVGGIAAMALPLGQGVSLVGLILVGLGCAPIFPCIIHATPHRFGAERSQAMIGVQMASAYVGTCLMPPVFGLLAQHVHVALYPAYLLVLLVLMAVTHEALLRKTEIRITR